MTSSDKLRTLIRYARPELPAEQVEHYLEVLGPAWESVLATCPDQAFEHPAGCHQLLVSVRECLI